MKVYVVSGHSRPYPKDHGAFVAVTTVLASSAPGVAVFYKAVLAVDPFGILEYSALAIKKNCWTYA